MSPRKPSTTQGIQIRFLSLSEQQRKLNFYPPGCPRYQHSLSLSLNVRNITRQGSFTVHAVLPTATSLSLVLVKGALHCQET